MSMGLELRGVCGQLLAGEIKGGGRAKTLKVYMLQKAYLGRNHIVSTSFRTITMLCFN